MSKSIVKAASAEEMALLDNSYPVEQGFTRILLPRLEFVSQDKTEGKGKSMKVVIEAGTFFKSIQTKEKDENDKPIWEKEELGKDVELIIVYERKQLKFYDGEKYHSSPVYDTNDQIIPLFKDKAEIAKGTPAELRAMKQYQGVSQKGKPMSKLEETRVLYVLLDDEMYQFSIRGTSMYAYLDYKKEVQPNKVVTSLNSEPQENGSTEWNQITWTNLRPLTSTEVHTVVEKITEIKEAIKTEQEFFANKNTAPEEVEADSKFKALGSGNKDF